MKKYIIYYIGAPWLAIMAGSWIDARTQAADRLKAAGLGMVHPQDIVCVCSGI